GGDYAGDGPVGRRAPRARGDQPEQTTETSSNLHSSSLKSKDQRAGEDVVVDLRPAQLLDAHVLQLGDHVEADVEAQRARDPKVVRDVEVGIDEQACAAEIDAH